MTQEEVLSLFDYREGNLYWKIKPHVAISEGDLAGSKNGAGYWHIQFKKVKYKAHRLIYLYHYGYLPKEIDHINGDKLDNRIENLRACTRFQNNRNRRANVNSTSKYKGVSWHSGHKRWSANISIEGKFKHLGYFPSEYEAARAYDQAALPIHKEFTKLNIVQEI